MVFNLSFSKRTANQDFPQSKNSSSSQGQKEHAVANYLPYFSLKVIHNLQHLKQYVKNDAKITKTRIWGTFVFMELEHNCIRQVNWYISRYFAFQKQTNWRKCLWRRYKEQVSGCCFQESGSRWPESQT